MSGHLECPACEIRTVEVADGILYGREVRCTRGLGCAARAEERADAICDLLANLPARREAEQDAARAREERIREAREKVLEAARVWWHDETCSDLLEARLLSATAILIAAEAEGETP